MMGKEKLLKIEGFLLAILVKTSIQSFVLTGPKTLLQGTLETFCVTVEDIIYTVANCTLELISSEENMVFATTNHRLNGIKDCFRLSVPITENEVTSARLRWQMDFDGLPDYKVNMVKEVAMSQKELEPLIQTDKLVYTPGQLVRFRILGLNHFLLPNLNLINRVYIVDPSGATVNQWTNLTTTHGLFQLEHQLAPEPVKGVWKIQVERGLRSIGEKEFEVREYVLPKFEVIVHPPDLITYNQEGDNAVQSIPMHICAKYSYGQPVRGTWESNIKVISNGRYYRWNNLPPPLPVINIERRGLLNNDTGCHTITLNGDQLGLSSYDGTIEKTIKVTVSVVEQGTGIQMNATWSTLVKRQALVIDIATWSSSTFKHGLPYYGIIKVSTIDGKPARETRVEICVQAQYNRLARNNADVNLRPIKRRLAIKRPSTNQLKHCARRVTDMYGLLSFELFPNELEITGYEIKATVSKAVRSKRQTFLYQLVAASPSPHLDLYAENQFNIRSTYSPSGSFLTFAPPTGYPKAIACHSSLSIKLYFTTEKEINFNLHYMVLARGDVVLTGIKQVKFREEDNIDISLGGETFLNKFNISYDSEMENKLVGDLDIEIEIRPDFSPRISLLAYYVRDDKELVSASFHIDIENCFPNPVNLYWSTTRKQPGKNVTLNLKGSPGSICGYSAVDRSVNYFRPDLQLSEIKIYDALSSFHIHPHSWPIQVTPEWEYCNSTSAKNDNHQSGRLRRNKRSSIHWPFSANLRDAVEAFDSAGVLVISNTNIETRPCPEQNVLNSRFGHRKDISGKSLIKSESFSGLSPFGLTRSNDPLDSPLSLLLPISTEKNLVSLRTYFPETFLWDLATLNNDGEWKETFELPHTITTWAAQALCISESLGFGLSSVSEIEAFQPFFLELHLPYSVKRTEKLKVKVSIFNYARHAIPVRLTIAYSEQFELLSESDTEILCILPQNNQVHNFVVNAIELGRHNVTVTGVVDDTFSGECGSSIAIYPSARDSVMKQLLVIPEGFPLERLYSYMSCPKDFDEDKSLTWDLTLPVDVVEGSVRAWVTVVGDLMGPALQGFSTLDSKLVRLPVGCGEQNMILFTPIIYIVQYLAATNQLEPSFRTKAVDLMKIGYQRELTYKRDDGSFSAFGKTDSEGSLWLTAFVVKSFGAAQRFIHVDEDELITSIQWLYSKQLENGCFPVIGVVLHNDLKGSLSEDDEYSRALTSFTLISLLELKNRTAEGSLMKNPKQLENFIENALSCLRLDEGEQRDKYTTALTTYALILAGRTQLARKSIDWMMTQAEQENSFLWWQKTGSGMSLRVEMTAYVLLSLVKLGDVNDLLKARSIVRWLSKQRNSEGGFVSTQDTIVALQAISAYAELIGSRKSNVEVVITADDFEDSIRIQEHNQLVQRRIDLPSPLASEIKIDTIGDGNGCVILQSTLRYNVHKQPPSQAFDLTVTTSALKDESCSTQQILSCVRYSNSTGATASNMAILEINLVSGYAIRKQSLEALIKTALVKRFELQGDDVLLYFDEINSLEEYCVAVEVQAVFEVYDAKKANVKIYDYYQPEYQQSVAYHLPNHNECILHPKIEAGLVNVDILDNKSIFNSLLNVESTVELTTEQLNETSDGKVTREPVKHLQPGQMMENIDRLGFSFNDDLDVPDGISGPIPTFVLPGHVRGCPHCVSIMPHNLTTVYCQTNTAFLAETRPKSLAHRLRLQYDVSRGNTFNMKLNSTVDLLLEPHCFCSFFESGSTNTSVLVLGLPTKPHPSPPQKLVVGSELWIIEKNHKQFNARMSNAKC